MGRYVISKSPVVKMDIMVAKEYLPMLASHCKLSGCSYEREEEVTLHDRAWVCLKNVEGKGHQLGVLLGCMYGYEKINGIDPNEKFYIILNAKKKGKKKNVCEDRAKVDARSESGTAGEPAGNAGPEQDPGYCGVVSDAGDPGIDDPGEQPGLPDTIDGRCE